MDRTKGNIAVDPMTIGAQGRIVIGKTTMQGIYSAPQHVNPESIKNANDVVKVFTYNAGGQCTRTVYTSDEVSLIWAVYEDFTYDGTGQCTSVIASIVAR